MDNFNDLELVEGYGYEVDPDIAEELGAFVEAALSEDDAKEAIQEQGDEK
ncbi:hypothetical protein [uncultured Campylobacter sp.]|jgi:conjugal transfer protein|nr:hypothetical protein [uncultured Campylobacter sp.]